MSIIQEALKKVEPPPAAAKRAAPPPSAAPEPVRIERRIEAPLPAPRPQRAVRRIPPAAVIVAVTAVAIALAAALLVAVAMRGPHAPVPAPREPAAPETAPAESHQETIYKKVEPAVPPSPVSDVRSVPPDLALNGIMYLDTNPRAIINNAIVGKGDMVSGATVTAINKKSVILTYNDVEITLNLK